MSERRIAKQLRAEIKPIAYKFQWAKQTLKFMGEVKYPFSYEALKLELSNKSQDQLGLTEEKMEVVKSFWLKWQSGVKNQVNYWGEEKWKENMLKKSSLKLYRQKSEIKSEPIYDNSYGSSLLFEARAGSLHLRNRTSKWSSDGKEECVACGHASEDLVHILFECKGYVVNRLTLIHRLRLISKDLSLHSLEESSGRSDVMSLLLGFREIEKKEEICACTKQFLEGVFIKRGKLPQ